MNPRKIATHDGTFHADDLFAIATLKLAFPEAIIIRTRDEKELETADLRVDVGRKYNDRTGDFDHHQAEGAGTRANGIPYASFGLIWKELGKRLTGSKESAERIDHEFVQAIDANDCGIDLSNPKTIRPYTISRMVAVFNPTWEEERDHDTIFEKLLPIAMKIIRQEIAHAKGRESAKSIVEKAVKDSKRRCVILDNYCPWDDVVIESKALFVIYPSSNGVDWTVHTVPIKKGSFETRLSLPKEWAGKSETELQKTSGINDAVFCHRNLFMARAGSKESAIKMAEIAMNTNEKERAIQLNNA